MSCGPDPSIDDDHRSEAGAPTRLRGGAVEVAAHRHGLLAGILALVVFVSFALAVTAWSSPGAVGAPASAAQLTAGDDAASRAPVAVVRGRFDGRRFDGGDADGGGRGRFR